jgi:hypothetical protein
MSKTHSPTCGQATRSGVHLPGTGACPLDDLCHSGTPAPPGDASQTGTRDRLDRRPR